MPTQATVEPRRGAAVYNALQLPFHDFDGIVDGGDGGRALQEAAGPSRTLHRKTSADVREVHCNCSQTQHQALSSLSLLPAVTSPTTPIRTATGATPYSCPGSDELVSDGRFSWAHRKQYEIFRSTGPNSEASSTHKTTRNDGGRAALTVSDVCKGTMI